MILLGYRVNLVTSQNLVKLLEAATANHAHGNRSLEDG